MDLKKELLRVRENNYLVENNRYFEISKEMVKEIGSIDSELRDNIIYTTFYKWIMEGKLKGNELKEILRVLIGQENLFYKIGEVEGDGVFKRSFSVLVIALIIYFNRENSFLTSEEVYEVKNKVVRYMNEERDLRGFVYGKGWAHSVAHTADCLDELSNCSLFNKEDLMEILSAIKSKAVVGYYSYVDGEDERMVVAVISTMNRGKLSIEDCILWVNSFKEDNEGGTYIESYHSKVNKKNFLKSLYFSLMSEEGLKRVNNEVLKVLKEVY